MQLRCFGESLARPSTAQAPAPAECDALKSFTLQEGTREEKPEARHCLFPRLPLASVFGEDIALSKSPAKFATAVTKDTHS